MASVLITGGTGMIGKALTKELVRKGFSVCILSRSKKATANNVTYKHWDPEAGIIDPTAIAEADHIVHLAGANVAEKRWTPERKAEIRNSRVKSGELLCTALKEMPHKVSSIVSASAIGWYGADKDIPASAPFTESDPPDPSFLGATAREWEEAVSPLANSSTRLVILRIGIVLSNEGGAYAEFKKPLRLGVASVLGSGKQVVSWIHIDDLVGMIIFALENRDMKGVYNAVAPRPVSNEKLISCIAAQKGGLSLKAKVPAFALRLVLGELSVEVLKSATVSSAKVAAAGYGFRYRKIEEAVAALE